MMVVPMKMDGAALVPGKPHKLFDTRRDPWLSKHP